MGGWQLGGRSNFPTLEVRTWQGYCFGTFWVSQHLTASTATKGRFSGSRLITHVKPGIVLGWFYDRARYGLPVTTLHRLFPGPSFLETEHPIRVQSPRSVLVPMSRLQLVWPSVSEGQLSQV